MCKEYVGALPEGYNLRQYEIKEVLGQGGFGVTYLAKDTMLDILVAIKEFYPNVLGMARTPAWEVRVADKKDQKLFDQCLERFVDEGRNIARFRNENIVRIMSFFKDNGTAYLIMEFVEGESLEAKFQKGEWRGEMELMGVLRPLMKALQLLHNEGFVHRDVKPANIYIRKDGSPLLLDFGAARQFVSENSSHLTTFLTPGFAPIEQYSGKKSEHGPWTDIYSLAAVLYTGVVGKPPLDMIARSNSLLHNGTDPLVPAMRLGKEKYSRVFLASIDRALKVGPKERPQNMDEWLHLFRMDNDTRTVQTVADTQKDREYIIKIIGSISFFRGFSEEEQKRFVSNYTRIQKCAPGVYIVREGSKDSAFYILLSGSVSAIKNGNPVPLSEMGPGSIFGEISFLTNMPRTANVVANEPCLFVQVDKELMENLGAEIREKIKDRIIGQLLKRMTKMNQMLHNVIKASYVLMGTHFKGDGVDDGLEAMEFDKAD
ncbi:MAG: serine/threonine-protein kinase [Magnetococcus sp. YQC-5]